MHSRFSPPVRPALLGLIFLLGFLLSPGASFGQSPGVEEHPERPIHDRAAFFEAYRPSPGAEQEPGSPLPFFPEAAGAAPGDVKAGGLNKIVYQSYRDDNWELYLLDRDFGVETRLTVTSGVEVLPRMSWDTSKIYFASRVGDSYETFVMNIDGSGRRQLTDWGDNAVNAVPSPNGMLVAFDYKKDIYLMNSDGSYRTRLTTDEGYDGEPTWSPDGSKIAFISNRAQGGYRVWVMNADGSNQTQLSYTPSSTGPTWSPDGKQIAFSADLEGDGWLELWVMNADGTNARVLARPTEANTDYYAYSWNPGSSQINFTSVHWVTYYGYWFWDRADLRNIRLYDNVLGSYGSPSTTEWNLDYQSLDRTAPTVSLNTPAVVPASYTIPLVVNDFGGSGLDIYYVQYKKKLEDPWVLIYPYTNPSPWYGSDPIRGTGLAGDTAYYRVMVVDKAGFFSQWPDQPHAFVTVESLPPISKIDNLAPFNRPEFTVQWTSVDPGGSGVQKYVVQYHTGDGVWVNWLTGTPYTSAVFPGELGGTYTFRVRGTDFAGNREVWSDASQASTLVYSFAISGKLTDNAGVPVGGALVTPSSPDAIAPPSSVKGDYAIYFTAPIQDVTTTWSKPGYGDLPAATFSAQDDVSMPVVLPPVDDRLVNGNLEAGLASWSPGGALPPSLVDKAHTGGGAVRLFDQEETIYSRYLISDLVPRDSPKFFATGPDSRLHLTYFNDAGYGMYIEQLPDGSFSAPVKVSTNNHQNSRTFLYIDPNNGVNIIWAGYDGAFFAYRNPSGVWTPEVKFYSGYVILQYSDSDKLHFLQMDGAGGLHFLWYAVDNNYDHYFLHSYRSPGGVWSETVIVPGSAAMDDMGMLTAAFDASNRLHVGYFDGSYYHYLKYTSFTPGGGWMPAQQITRATAYYSLGNFRMGIRPNSLPYLTFAIDNQVVYFKELNEDGSWSDTRMILRDAGSINQILNDGAQGFYLLLSKCGESRSNLCVYRLKPDGSVSIQTQTPTYEDPVLWLGENETIYLSWLSRDPMAYNLARWEPGKEWAFTEYYTLVYAYSPMFVTRLGIPFFLCEYSEHSSAPINIYLDTPTIATVTGQSKIEQTVSIPSNMTAPTLSFLYRSPGREAPSGSLLKAEVVYGATTTTLFSTGSRQPSWTHTHFDLSRWKGKTVTVRLVGSHQAGTLPRWFYIDDISLGSGHPDLHVLLPEPYYLVPGGTGTLELAVHNQGPAPAGASSLEVTLPEGLTFVSADPSPASADGQALRWDISALGPGGRQVIRLRLSAARGLVLWSSQWITLDLAPSAGELELENNHHQAEVVLGARLSLPFVNKK